MLYNSSKKIEEKLSIALWGDDFVKTLIILVMVVLLSGLVFLSCQNTLDTAEIITEEQQEEEPETSLGEQPGEEEPELPIVDGAHGGNQSFFFLPPLIQEPIFSGEPESELDLVIEIIDLSAENFLASFSTSYGEGPELIRYDSEEGHYIVNFSTRTYPITPGQIYRIRAFSGDTELGYIDILAVESPSDPETVEEEVFQRIYTGRTLPVKFRIEKESDSSSS